MATGTLVAASMIAIAGPTQAAVEPTAAVIIHEVYGGGGNSGAAVKHDFLELYNTTNAPVDLAGWSVQYASSSGTNWSGLIPLTGSIAAKSTFLIQGATGTAGAGARLPDADATSTLDMSGANGNVALSTASAKLTCLGAACASDPAIVDLVGYGTGANFAGAAPAPAASNSTSVSRTAGVNSANNVADFTAGAPSPTNAAGETLPAVPPVEDAGDLAIAQIQGTGNTSPVAGKTATTKGVVTAAYPAGGFGGYAIQTEGTGGPLDPAQSASHGLFVYSPATVGAVEIGDYVEVAGLVSEFNGLTQMTVEDASGLEVLAGAGIDPIAATPAAWPATDAKRELLESMLVQVTGDMTVTNTFSTHQYGEVGLASGTKALVQPTDAVRPGPQVAVIEAENAKRAVVLDDGASTNFLSSGSTSQTPPYVSLTNPVRVGAKATFTDPVVVDYRNNTWKLNPTKQVLPGAETVSFANTRTPAPDAGALGAGDLRIASFNVLNYFTTLGANVAGCTAYNDRAGAGITTKSCPGNGPRGAWNAANLTRQQDKIVAAINATDASVTGLMEIENSVVLGQPVDSAVTTLVAALNDASQPGKWAFVPSSGDLPATAEQDVITNAIIYQPALVTPVHRSLALGTQSGPGGAYVNAREPIAQIFTAEGGGEEFLAVVNHFKSKGSAGSAPGDADSGDGQAASNGSRILQATALASWVGSVQASFGVAPVALLGDFNAYTMEDPLEVLYDAGYVDAVTDFGVDKASYSFSGLSGSLDHVLLNAAFRARATGADIWNINAPESIALEYSRYNAVGTLFYADNAYRSSDHDPVIVNFSPQALSTSKINLLNTNDFHGRIDKNAVKFAGTVEQLRAERGEDKTLFFGAGDLIGASLFASASAEDRPTIDVFNALKLNASSVGNHEFDKGYQDLVKRVAKRADWEYLGANVYLRGTDLPALPTYKIFEINGVKVGVIGAVTEDTPSLVTPGGIAALDFRDPVAGVNQVAAQLSNGDEDDDEADIIVAEYHEGAALSAAEGGTLANQVAAGGAFARIVLQTAPEVDAIFTGHTHKTYAWDAKIPGQDRTRPVLQTGSYGDHIGQVVLTVDNASKELLGYTMRNVARTTTADDVLVATYPRVAAVKGIVDAAIAEADVAGSVVVGSVTADITTAFIGTARDDRSRESTLGNLVANSLRESLSSPETGGAEIGIVNPGGLRAELLYAKSGDEATDGQVTFAEANAVLPFVNNLWTTTLTGAQFKVLLEQQWQTNAAGEVVTARPFQQLGFSDNVSYTYDASRELGDRITSIAIDGKAIEEGEDYRIGTFSFLAQGGDNFRVFGDASGTTDSGLVDRDAWIAYLKAHADLTPDFARHAVGVAGAPSSVAVSDSLEIAVSGLDLTSLGSPANSSIVATFTGGGLPAAGLELGSFPVTNGAASVTGSVPGAAAGADTLTLVAAPSGTTIFIPIEVATTPVVPTATTTMLVVSGELVAGKSVILRGAVSPANAVGRIEFRNGTTVLVG